MSLDGPASTGDLQLRRRLLRRAAPPALRALAVLLGSTALAVWLTWPLVGSLGTHLPQGTETVPTVPLLNHWTVWWNADRAAAGFADYWNAPIFHPVRGAFAFSEAQPTTLLVAPLVGAARPALAYNVYLLAVLALNGAMGYRLLRRAGLAAVPALCGGAMCEALPIVQWQLGVLQLTTVCGVLWVLDAVAALAERPTLGRAVVLGTAAAVCYAACNYFGLFLTALLPIASIPLMRHWPDWAGWYRLLTTFGVRGWLWRAWDRGGWWAWPVAVAVAGLLAAPILHVQREAKQEHEWTRPDSDIVNLSAHAGDYCFTPWSSLIDGPAWGDPNRAGWMLGPGVVKLGLAAAGVVVGLVLPGRRRLTLFLLLFGGLAFAWSLGPTPWLLGYEPYRWLMKVHPGIAVARSPFRFAFFVQIAVSLLAAFALHSVWSLRRVARLLTGRARRPTLVGVTVVTLALGVVAVAEVRPAPQPLHELPDAAKQAGWLAWIEANVPPDEPIVCLPFVEGNTVEDYEPEARKMHFQTLHRRPLVGGYSGFFPRSNLDLRDEMSYFPDAPSIKLLKSLGVKYVVALTPVACAKADLSPGLIPAVTHDVRARVSIYELK